MKFSEWEGGVPASIRGDTAWRVTAYRLALFAADIGWQDVVQLAQDRRMLSLSDQLYRALGSVSANIGEGYGRGSAKDRVRFYEYALGSARESRDWYYKARHVLVESVVTHRMDLQVEIIRLLLTMIPDERGYTVGEVPSDYNT